MAFSAERAFEPDELVTFYSGRLVEEEIHASQNNRYRMPFARGWVILGDCAPDGTPLSGQCVGAGGAAFINDNLRLDKLVTTLHDRVKWYDLEAPENQFECR